MKKIIIFIFLSTISSQNIFQFLTKDINTGLYIESSKNQSFFTYKKGSNFINEKIDSEDYIIPQNISCVRYNQNVPRFINNNINTQVFSLVDVVLKNIMNLKFKKNFKISPIYISNNTILN